jgi:2-polyprenyl-3-methyl-5-hydroxy-6-metoxy-1,4-benzoquinol methylase
MKTIDILNQLFQANFSLKNIRNTSKEHFVSTIKMSLGTISGEDYVDLSKQRDLSIKFHWGHNHDFGEGFSIEGRMRNRHLEIVSQFIDDFELPLNLSGKKILDVGVWTGGTSLLLAAMGASVSAVEEVRKYSDTVNYLAESFGIQDKLKCYSANLYDFIPMYADEFDYIIYAGVIYHVTDPILSLRQMFSALRNKGSLFVETYGLAAEGSVCKYEGTNIFSTGTISSLDRTGWNYFIPSQDCLFRWLQDVGFQEIKVSGCIKNRILARATRESFKDFCRAGLSNRFVR